jgi:hypothetical protein
LNPPRYGTAKRLETVVSALENRLSRQPVAKEDRLQDAASLILAIHAGKASPKDLSPRHLRVLAWSLNHGTPRLSSSPALLVALGQLKGSKRTKDLLGLIATFVSAHSLEPPLYLAWATQIQQMLLAYQGGIPDLGHWKHMAPLLFAPDAASRIGKWVLGHEETLQRAIAELCPPSWGGKPRLGSPLFDNVLKAIFRAIAFAPNYPARLDEALDLLDSQVQDPELRVFAANLFLERFAREPHLGAHEGLLDFCLLHFKDPRLERSTAWLAFSRVAKEVCQGWISRVDLELFFRSVTMDDRRRQFWLRYVDQMNYSRIILGPATQRVSDPALQKFLKQNRHATLDDPLDSTASAVIIRIRDVYIVEFSYNGDACYLYRQEELPFDLDASTYVKSASSSSRNHGRQAVLKKKFPLPEPYSTNRIIHNGAWESKAIEKLRFYGITRTTKGGR